MRGKYQHKLCNTERWYHPEHPRPRYESNVTIQTLETTPIDSLVTIDSRGLPSSSTANLDEGTIFKFLWVLVQIIVQIIGWLFGCAAVLLCAFRARKAVDNSLKYSGPEGTRSQRSCVSIDECSEAGLELNPRSTRSDTSSPASNSFSLSLRPSIKSFFNWATKDQSQLYAQLPNESSSCDSGSGTHVEVHDSDEIPGTHVEASDSDEIESDIEIWRNSHSMMFVVDSNLEIIVWSKGMTRVGVVWLVDS